MRVVPHEKPSPRLLNSVAPEPLASVTEAPTGHGRSALGRGAFFRGNGLAIFGGLLLGGGLLAAAGWLHDRHIAAERTASMQPILHTVATDSVSSSADRAATPAPILVQISDAHIRVTAISLGHPRLAVINNQHVGEGDFVSVHAPTVRVQVKLRVTKIGDGRIELSDGTQTIIAHLAVPALKCKTP